MGRIKTYDIQQLLMQIGTIFIENGYEGSSLDDLERGTGLRRGSLYREFGSKQRMFELSLAAALEQQPSATRTLDLIIIGLQELASVDHKISKLLLTWYQAQNDSASSISELIGTRLIEKSKILTVQEEQDE